MFWKLLERLMMWAIPPYPPAFPDARQIIRFSDPGRSNLAILRQAESCAKLSLPFHTSDRDWLITEISTDGDDVVIKGIEYPDRDDKTE